MSASKVHTIPHRLQQESLGRVSSSGGGGSFKVEAGSNNIRKDSKDGLLAWLGKNNSRKGSSAHVVFDAAVPAEKPPNRKNSLFQVIASKNFFLPNNNNKNIEEDDVSKSLGWVEKDKAREEFEVNNASIIPENTDQQPLQNKTSLENVGSKKNNKQLLLSSSAVTTRTFDFKNASALKIQTFYRKHFTMIKYRSLVWVRNKLIEAIQSRSALNVEEALTGSRAIKGFFALNEHQQAVDSLTTIREEKALRNKIEEIADIKCLAGNDYLDVIKKYGSVWNRVEKIKALDRFAFEDAVSKKARFTFESCMAKRDTLKKLRNALNLRKPCLLNKALEFYDANSAAFSWDDREDPFAKTERDKARNLLVAIQHEEPIMGRVVAWNAGFFKPMGATVKGDWVAWNDVVQVCLQTHTGEEEEEEEVDEMRRILRGDNEFVTHYAKLLVAFTKEHDSLRAALVEKKPLDLVESHFGVTMHSYRELERACGEDETFQTALIASVCEQLNAIGAYLTKQAGIHDSIELLAKGVRETDLDVLRTVLRSSNGEKMRARLFDFNLQALLRDAERLVERYAQTHDELVAALQGTNRDYVELLRVAKNARLTYGTAHGDLDVDLLNECDRLTFLCLDDLCPLLEKTLNEIPDLDVLKSVLHRVEAQEGMGGMKELVALRELLSLSEDKLFHQQLRAATRNGNHARKIVLMVRLRELQLTRNAAYYLNLKHYVGLRDAEEWDKEQDDRLVKLLVSKLRKKNQPLDRMLTHSKYVLASPLTVKANETAATRRFAVKAHAAVLTYMGDLVDKKVGTDFLVACSNLYEVLSFARANPNVRDEVYLLLMKQLRWGGRKRAYSKRGVNCLMLCLISFPCSVSFDFHLEAFLRFELSVEDEKERAFLLRTFTKFLFLDSGSLEEQKSFWEANTRLDFTLDDVVKNRDAGVFLRGFKTLQRVTSTGSA